MKKILCMDCGYGAKAETFSELEKEVEKDGGLLEVNDGEIDDFGCPDCSGENGEIEEE